MAFILGDQENLKPRLRQNLEASSPFSIESNMRANHSFTKKMTIKFGDTEYKPTVVSIGSNHFNIQLENGKCFDVSGHLKKVYSELPK